MPSINWSGANFLSFDPGIQYTGFAAYRLPSESGGVPRLLEYGKYNNGGADKPDLLRAWHMAEQAVILARKHKAGFAFIEQPPDTIYNQKEYIEKREYHKLTARAQSLFRTVGVFYALATAIRTQTQTLIQPILPSQWELGPAQRGRCPVKEWSLEQANKLIKHYFPEADPLGTGSGQNTADAISIGYFGYQREYAP